MDALIARLRQHPQYYILLSLISASFLSLSWYFPFTPLAFLGLAPLLEMESQIAEKKPKYPTLQFFLYGWLTLCLWNVGVIWWLWNAAGWATLGAWIANSLLQVLPLVAFQIIKRTSANRFGYFAFVVCWVTFECVHFQWDLSWGSTGELSPSMASSRPSQGNLERQPARIFSLPAMCLMVRSYLSQ